jgi:hypothetical protein
VIENRMTSRRDSDRDSVKPQLHQFGLAALCSSRSPGKRSYGIYRKLFEAQKKEERRDCIGGTGGLYRLP